MKARLKFCLSMLEESSISHDPVFKSMHNVVHIDEKWFYMSPKSSKFYLLATEDDPYRTCKNKNYIGKAMFSVVVTNDEKGLQVAKEQQPEARPKRRTKTPAYMRDYVRVG